ncbi:PTS glucose transporter subunit IIA [Bacillus sp. S3]|uniref:PTS sugar transporter subunit IIA n=1 Tax=Bacillus sp. S3 TaxID=486398 RepID=UPI0011889F7B|nr:PTS glucose transporter subunit IIA [Bacillus sp. S3]QCJ44680.1 PTS glucose transporter subunit IIA [Bacillus sp. S3]
MLFKKNKKSENIAIQSPLNAEVIKLESVPDPVFSQKMMGEGIGFIPTNGEIYSPISGKVTQVFPTKHAIGLMTEDGVELLLHLGLETVELNGEGFDILIESGDRVQAQDRIGSFDLTFIEEKGKEIISVLVFPNLKEKGKELTLSKTGEVKVGTEIANLHK